MFTDEQILNIFNVMRKLIAVNNDIDKVIEIITKDKAGYNTVYSAIDELCKFIEIDIYTGNPNYQNDNSIFLYEYMCSRDDADLIKIYKSIRDEGMIYKIDRRS